MIQKITPLVFKLSKIIDSEPRTAEIFIGGKRHAGMCAYFDIRVRIDDGEYRYGWRYDIVKKMICSEFKTAIKFPNCKTPIFGFTISDEQDKVLIDHLTRAEIDFNEEFERQIAQVLNGDLLTHLWFGSGLLNVCLDDSARNTDVSWQKVLDTAHKRWIKSRFPYVDLFEIRIERLTYGLWLSDSVNLTGAIPSKESFETVGSGSCPKSVNVPLSSLMERVETHYANINNKIECGEVRKNSLIEAAKTSGEKQIWSTFVSDYCHDNLHDCSFDNVTIWIDEHGNLSETYTHCY